MMNHIGQGELHYYLSQLAEMRFYTTVCIYSVDVWYPTYFEIYLALICFILPPKICLTVLQYLNHSEAS